MKYLGCAYYPEYWGIERVKEDIKLMSEAGINIVRIGEFAWTKMEPEEGVFNLDWLHQTINLFSKHNIDVLMCTPTATPPAWLTYSYPDTLLVRNDGSKAEHGRRRHYCMTSDSYRRHVARIVNKLTKEVSQYSNVIGWQIDNELGPHNGGRCYCENCQARFQAWLKKKYGTIEQLNKQWNTGFWSMDYSDWRQIRLGHDSFTHYSSRNFDSRIFYSDMMIDFAQHQASIIRKNHPGAIITTNATGLLPSIDFYKLFSDLDVASDDLYFDVATMDISAAQMNTFRSIKPGNKYWLAETGAGTLGTGKFPVKDQMKAWMWSNFAHGADAHIIFRWRTCLSGQEQELPGILEHSGRPRHRYQAVKESFLEMEKIKKKVGDLPLPQAKVGIIQDYEVLWGYEASRVQKHIDYAKSIFKIHKEFYRRNIIADFIPRNYDFSQYELLVLPNLMMVDKTLAKKVQRFVENGGIVLAIGQIGIRDLNDNYLSLRGPQYLQDLFGVYIEGGMYLHSSVEADESLRIPEPNTNMKKILLQGSLADQTIEGYAGIWLADITLNGGKVLFKVKEEVYKDKPAIVENITGEGETLYINTVDIDEDLLSEIINYTLAKTDIVYDSSIPLYVETIERGNITFIINHYQEEICLDLDIDGKILLGKEYKSNNSLKLPPYGVVIVQQDNTYGDDKLDEV